MFETGFSVVRSHIYGIQLPRANIVFQMNFIGGGIRPSPIRIGHFHRGREIHPLAQIDHFHRGMGMEKYASYLETVLLLKPQFFVVKVNEFFCSNCGVIHYNTPFIVKQISKTVFKMLENLSSTIFQFVKKMKFEIH